MYEVDFVKDFFRLFKNEKDVYTVAFYNTLFVVALVLLYWLFE
jgi:hypothetical protein